MPRRMPFASGAVFVSRGMPYAPRSAPRDGARDAGEGGKTGRGADGVRVEARSIDGEGGIRRAAHAPATDDADACGRVRRVRALREGRAYRSIPSSSSR